MIRRLSSNKESFEAISFEPGFNIIIAERDDAASEQHSRNARGKTSVLQAINFCLGSALPSNFRSLIEDDWSFSLDLDLLGTSVRVTRRLQRRSRIQIESAESDLSRMPFWNTYWDAETRELSLDNWKYLLGLGLFGLDEEQETYGLSPRTLISYIVRLNPPVDPLKVIAQQPAWSSRQHVAYLLGLDWRHTRDLVAIDREEETYKALQVATDEQIAPGVIRSESDLMIERNEAAAAIADVRARLDSFNVIDRPEEVVRGLDALKDRILRLSDESVTDLRLINLYAGASIGQQEDLVGAADDAALVAEIYRELQRAFNADALRRFSEVEAFHDTLRQNRRSFLSSELTMLTRREQDRQAQLQDLLVRRDELQRVLNEGGGLDELLTLRADLGACEARLDEAERALRAVRDMSAAQAELGVRRAETRRAASQELEARRTHLDRVARQFDEMMQTLYAQNGVLTAEVDRSGYKFRIYVPNSTSGGVSHMRLFCFDLTMLSEGESTHHPNFLVHDSPVFDGVDPRQRESALRMAHDIVTDSGRQYIVALNSNDIPDGIIDADWYLSSVRRTIYDTEVGGAMGVVF